MALRAGCQAATFILIARIFDPSIYGQFVAVVCVGVLVAPLVTAGIEYVTVSMIATQRASTAECLGTGLRVLATLSPAGVGLAVLYSLAALEISMAWRWVVLLLVCEIVFVPALEILWRAYQANERMEGVALLRALPAAFKLLAAALLTAGFFAPSMSNWIIAYAGATLLAAAVGVCLAQRDFGLRRLEPRGAVRAVREGWPFAAYSLAERATNDVDKLLLASLAGAREAGLYAAAYRLVEVFSMPVMAVLLTMNAAIYRAGVAPGPALGRLLWKLAWGVTAYGLCAAFVIVLGKDIAVRLLGAAYAESAQPLAALALLPWCYGLRVLLGLGLASIGRQFSRMWVQCAAAATSICLCLLAIPAYGLPGAAYATVATEILTILTLGVLLRTGLGSDRRDAMRRTG